MARPGPGHQGQVLGRGQGQGRTRIMFRVLVQGQGGR